MMNYQMHERISFALKTIIFFFYFLMVIMMTIFDELVWYWIYHIIKCNESSAEHQIKSKVRQVWSKDKHGNDIQ